MGHGEPKTRNLIARTRDLEATSDIVATRALANRLAEAEDAVAVERQLRAEAADSDEALRQLLVLLAVEDRSDEAATLLRSAIAAGRRNLRVLLANVLSDHLHELEAAEQEYRTAIEEGHAFAIVALAVTLEGQGRTLEAERLYRAAIAEGAQRTNWQLGELLASSGRPEEAQRAYRAAIEAGELRAHVGLGELLETAGDRPAAEHHFREAADWGYPTAWRCLAALLQDTGRYREAVATYEEAMRRGLPGMAIGYGNLLSDRPDTLADAERWYRRALDEGHPEAAANLGVVLEQQGRPEQAEQAYRIGVAGGDALSMRHLGRRLASHDNPDDHREAEQLLRAAYDAGDAKALVTLGNVFEAWGNPDLAETCYRRALAEGVEVARSDYADLLADAGREQEAEREYRVAAAAGESAAAWNLGVLLEDERPADAVVAYETALRLGDADAHLPLAELLESLGRPDEAEVHYLAAVDTNDDEAVRKYGKFLAKAGRSPHLRSGHQRFNDENAAPPGNAPR